MSLAYYASTNSPRRKEENILARLRRLQLTPKIDLDLIRPKDAATGNVVPYTPRKNQKLISATGVKEAPADNDLPEGYVWCLSPSGVRQKRIQPPDYLLEQLVLKESKSGSRYWYWRDNGKPYRPGVTVSEITGRERCANKESLRQALQNRLSDTGQRELSGDAETSTDIEREDIEDAEAPRGYQPRPQPSLASSVGMIFDRDVWTVDLPEIPGPTSRKCKNPNFTCENTRAPGQSYCPSCHGIFHRKRAR